jgi:transposase-like protein
VRKSSRQSWTPEAMESAIRDVQAGVPVRTAARQHGNIPRNTLKRRVLNRNKQVRGSDKGLGHSQCIPPEIEDELVRYVKSMESRLFGLTKKEVCRMAYDIAEQNAIVNTFNKELKRAGDDWFQSFLQRHPDLSLRVPEATSAARAQGFNRPVVKNFFEVLEHEMAANNIQPDRIYNCDETGIQTSHRPGKIVATKGRKQVGSLTSCDRGVNTTAVVAVSATGHFIPPMLIFARVRFKAELMDNTSPGTIGVCRKKGWMDSLLFIDFLKHFIYHVHCTPSNKVLLLLDGHGSHKTLETVEFCRSNGIILICFPAHCTHRMQPLDVAFFAPLMTYYNQEVGLWLKNHPGRIVTQFQVAGLFSKAFQRAASVSTAAHAFESTGIVPLNPNIFPDHLFSPCDTTDRPHDPSTNTLVPFDQPAASTPLISTSELQPCSSLNIQDDSHADEPLAPSSTLVPSCSPAAMFIPLDVEVPPLSTSAVLQPCSPMAVANGYPAGELFTPTSTAKKRPAYVSPFDISPLPVAERCSDERPKRRRMSATILTGSPFLKELKETAKSKEEKAARIVSRKKLFTERRQQEKIRKQSRCGQKKMKVTKKKKLTCREDRPRKKRPCQPSGPKQRKKSGKKSSGEEVTQRGKIKGTHKGQQEKEYHCIYCSELYVDPPLETWLGCDSCKQWAHQACADVSGSQRFVCDLCA